MKKVMGIILAVLFLLSLLCILYTNCVYWNASEIWAHHCIV